MMSTWSGTASVNALRGPAGMAVPHWSDFHFGVVRSVRLWPDLPGPPEGGHYMDLKNALALRPPGMSEGQNAVAKFRRDEPGLEDDRADIYLPGVWT